MNDIGILYLSRADVEATQVSMAEVIAAVEEGFRRKGMGETQMPPKTAVKSRPGEAFLHAMPAYVGGLDIAGLKWVGGNDANRERGLPNITGLIILNDPQTMFPLAVMDASWITMMRTGAANAVAMKYLGPEIVEEVAVIGLGVQGRSNLLAMRTLYPDIREVRIYDVSPEAVDRYVADVSSMWGFAVKPVGGYEEAVAGADIVVTAGPNPKAPEPYLKEAWLKPGAMAAPVDYMGAWEVEMAQKADKLITDDIPQMDYYRSNGYFKGVPQPYADLGEIVAGTKPGRQCADERTMSIMQGIAVDDAVTAKIVYDRAVAQGIGVALSV